jgi:hypothetical protein
MSLQVPSQDLVVGPWGKILHGHDSESYGGTHHVARAATSDLKAQLEDKFHMYYLCFS